MEVPLKAARATVQTLLLSAPKDPSLIGLLSVVAVRQGQLDEAEKLLRQCLALKSDSSVRLPSLYRLGSILERTSRGAELRRLAADEAPDWPADRPAVGDQRRMVPWLAELLLVAGQLDKVRRLLDSAFPERAADADAVCLAGRLSLEEGDGAAAIAKLEDAVRLAPGDSQKLLALGHAQYRLRNTRPAVQVAGLIIRSWPVHIDPPRPSHRASLLVLNQAPKSIRSPSLDLRNTNYTQNFATEMEKSMRGTYRFLSLFADLPDGEYLEPLPEAVTQAELVLNNMVNSERLNEPGLLDLLRARLSRLDVPVVNHPDQAARTTREDNARLLQGVANLKVPKIARFRTDLMSPGEILAAINRDFDYPLILRKSNAHQSAQSLLAGGLQSAVLLPDGEALRGIWSNPAGATSML